MVGRGNHNEFYYDPCDRTVLIWYVIWLCDMDIHITEYLLSYGI